MVTTRPVSKGREIFNTYGQMANWQLLHMYGFAEPYPGNTNDTADIQMVTVRRAALQREWPRGEGTRRSGAENETGFGVTSETSLFHVLVVCLPLRLLPRRPAPSAAARARGAALLSATGARSEAEQQLVAEQWDFLCQLEMVGEEGAFVLGWDEVLTEEELLVTLKVSAARGRCFREGGQVPEGVLVPCLRRGGGRGCPAPQASSAAGCLPLLK